MPRTARVNVGEEFYHVINRANGRLKIFFQPADFILFEGILEKAKNKYDMRIIAYCLMPNHFHLVLHPRHDGDMSKFMQWITLTHTQRWHMKNGTTGTGHLYQGRYKSFLIEGDRHLLSVIRYVERNPLRAGLVSTSDEWEFSSLSKRISGKRQGLLDEWPIEEPDDYLSFVNDFADKIEEEMIRYSVNRGKPFGGNPWSNEKIQKYGLEATVRNRGRQIKGT